MYRVPVFADRPDFPEESFPTSSLKFARLRLEQDTVTPDVAMSVLVQVGLAS